MSFPAGLRTLGTLLLWVILPLLIGWLLAVKLVPEPIVGLIRVKTDIWSGSNELIMKQIEEARQDPGVKAVVVEFDSAGGEVVASQALYLELQKLRQEMPVVGSIDNVAASGAYYAALGADPLYAKPSSTIGNIGVWSVAPPEIAVNDMIIASGPFKLTASNWDEFMQEIEGIKQEFLATVESQRGDRLKISLVDLSQGLAYPGRQALHLGLVDQLGSRTEAADAAARQAGLANYEVVDLEARVLEKLFEQAGQQPPEVPLTESWPGSADPDSGQRQLPPGVYLLYDPSLGGQP
jgi:signal peptide peptidase SppA